MKEQFRRAFLYFDQNLYLLMLMQVFLGMRRVNIVLW